MEPYVVLSNPAECCATFVWLEPPDVYIGYRFLEGDAQTGPPRDYRDQPRLVAAPHRHMSNQPVSRPVALRPDWLEAFDGEIDDRGKESRLRFGVEDSGAAWAEVATKGAAVLRRFGFQPAADGVWLTLEVVAAESITSGYYLQQCLRFTGAVNSAWRREIAHVPFLSELDMQAMGNANGTLTYARQDGNWRRFPVQFTRLQMQTSSNPMDGQADHGLIIRETPSRQEAPVEYYERVAPGTTWARMASGFYWERTAAISNRHPADCLHAWVDVGPLEAGESRTVHGKVYFLEGDKDDLLRRWQDDFDCRGET